LPWPTGSTFGERGLRGRLLPLSKRGEHAQAGTPGGLVRKIAWPSQDTTQFLGLAAAILLPCRVPKRSPSPFTRATLQFLAELGHHNERAWFEANKARYERDVRDPALALIRSLAPHLKKVSRHLVASDKKVGGSLMRVHRDVRFARDKAPYKTNIGIQFRHEAGKDVHAPGLYLHVEAERCFLGAGLWHPEPEALAAIREAIQAKPAAWRKARDDAAFRRHFSLAGESLKRPPAGIAADHPLVEDLKRKDHMAVVELEPADAIGAGFPELVIDRFAAARPYLRFLTSARGLRF
jgi:uncharacterized protein (TIGR02453 family)